MTNSTEIVADIITPRLRITPLTRELAALQVDDLSGFFDALGVEFEPAWPPQFATRESLEWMKSKLAERPEDTGWYQWIYISPVMNRLMGTGGFVGPVDARGQIEIRYSMLLSFREQGLATEGVSALLDWAYAHDAVKQVVAYPRADGTAAIRILEKLGFEPTGTCHTTSDGDVLDVYLHKRTA